MTGKEYNSRRDLMRWRPPVWGLVVTALGVAVFIGLGAWQLERAAEKRALLAAAAEGERAAPLERLPHADGERDDTRYRRVAFTGRYLPGRQVLLESMPANGRRGYQVLTPLRLDDGDLVMVNRGWIAAAAGADTTPEISVTGDRGQVQGRLNTLPRPGVRLGDNAPVGPEQAPWPRVYLYPTAGELSIALGEHVPDLLVQLDPGADDGYRREWQTVNFGPERHVGYAVQWFAFAVVALTIFILLTRPRGRDEDDG